MNQVYEDILREIHSCMEEEDYEEAMRMVKRELGMPYVPKDVEAQLTKLHSDLVYRLSEAKAPRPVDPEKLLAMLKGDGQMQLAAVSGLARLNLRDYMDDLKRYLAAKPCVEAASLLLEEIASQGIRDVLVYDKEGVEYTFFSDEITPVHASAGFLRALAILKEKIEADEPSRFRLARSVLVHEAYTYLPLSYEEDEAEALAEMVETMTAAMFGEEK